jgi:putative cardiolipin synthase
MKATLNKRHRRVTTRKQLLLALAVPLWLAACATVPFDYPQKVTTALPATKASELGRFASQWTAEHGDLSGFVGLASGNDALGARLRLIDTAQQTIDAQYFLIKPDQAGGLFVGKLLSAADRGVRVRLLIDDIFTPTLDSELSLFNHHPNVEVRLFNPLPRRGFKYLNMITDFGRANRRMHNKSFTVDGAISIVGGRNIAEEYFEIKPDVEFDDFELLTMGAVVPEVARAFDLFWNDELAVPIEAFGADFNPIELDQWRSNMEAVVSGAAESVYARAVGSPLLRDVREGRVPPIVASAYVVTDAPTKLQHAAGSREHQSLALELQRHFDRAQREIIIITPYFVPGKAGVATVQEWLQRGVRVVIVTNSLASTNHVPVHSGYARYRKQLVAAGAELYEIKADAVSDKGEPGENADARTLHTKAVVFDRLSMFVGSLNFDPRSIDINTEMGVFIESEVASRLAEVVFADLAESTYAVVLDEQQRKLRWRYSGGETPEWVEQEPNTGWWRRFSAGFYGLLPIEGQL